VWCGKSLPESTNKGHRRREFCNNTCKQRHYLWHQQIRHDADALAEPYWRTAYLALVERYKWLEGMVQARLLDLEKERKYTDELEKLVDYYKQCAKDLQTDYVARLQGLGLNEEQIKEFDEYWKRQLEEKQSEEQ